MKFRVKGLDKYVKQLENLSNPYNAEVCAENALIKGSDIVAEFTQKELQNIPTDDRSGKVEHRNGLRTIEKKFLISEFGVTPTDKKNDYMDRKTGVDKGRLDYPNSDSYVYAVVLARSLERGTSFLPKNPVFSRASRKARKPCLDAMEQSLTEDIERVMRNNQLKLQRSKFNG